jgi:hypothetical protein
LVQSLSPTIILRQTIAALALPPQSICTISISATALHIADNGPISGTLIVATKDTAGVHRLPLSTPTASVPASGAPIAFLPQAIGTTQTINYYYFDEGGDSDYESIEGPDTEDFSLGNGHSLTNMYSCSFRQCEFPVNFTPTTIGPHTTILSTSIGNVVVTGTGIPAGPSFAVTSRVPNPFVGTNGGPYAPNWTVTVLNNGTTSLNLSETITGSNASQFFVTTPCPQNLTMSSTCTFSVNFKPTQYGNIPAVLKYYRRHLWNQPVIPTQWLRAISTAIRISESNRLLPDRIWHSKCPHPNDNHCTSKSPRYTHSSQLWH